MKRKGIRLYRIREPYFKSPTWLIEYENDMWSSWTNHSGDIYGMIRMFLKAGDTGAQYSTTAYRRDLIEKIKAGKCPNALVARRVK